MGWFLGDTHLVHSEHDLLRRAGAEAGGEELVFLWVLKLWNINAMGHSHVSVTTHSVGMLV